MSSLHCIANTSYTICMTHTLATASSATCFAYYNNIYGYKQATGDNLWTSQSQFFVMCLILAPMSYTQLVNIDLDSI